MSNLEILEQSHPTESLDVIIDKKPLLTPKGANLLGGVALATGITSNRENNLEDVRLIPPKSVVFIGRNSTHTPVRVVHLAGAACE